MLLHSKETILTLEDSFLKHEAQCDQGSIGHMKPLDKCRALSSMADILTYQNLSSLRLTSHYPNLLATVFERFYKMCSDDNDNVKNSSEEALNKLIKEMLPFDGNKVFFEIHKELRKNGKMRSLRAALRRYSELAKSLQLQFLRSYAKDLDVILVRISNRDEEIIQEELRDAFLKISRELSQFFFHHQIKNLLYNWTNLLKSSSTTTRRMASSLLVSLVTNLKNNSQYMSILLQIVLAFVPLGIADYFTILGVLSVLKCLVPFLTEHSIYKARDKSITGSFGNVYSFENIYAIDVLIIKQAFIFCLHCTTHSNHIVCVSSLESLKQFFLFPDGRLLQWLIDSIDSELFYPILYSIEYNISDFEALFSSIALDIDTNVSDAQLSNEENIAEPQYSENTLKLGTTEFDIESESSDSDISELLEMTRDFEFDKDTYSNELIPFTEESIDDNLSSKDSASFFRNILDDDFSNTCLHNSPILLSPISRIIRRICKEFLLSGFPNCLISDDIIRISLKNSAITCVVVAISFKPELLFTLKIDDDFFHGPFQTPSDIINYLNYSDPSTVEKITIFIGDFIKSNLKRNCGVFTIPLSENKKYISVDFILHKMIKLLDSSDPLIIRAVCSGFQHFMPELVLSCHGETSVECIQNLIYLRNNSFWLIRLQIVNIIASFDLFNLAHLMQNFHNFQKIILHNYVPTVIFDEHPKVRESSLQLVSSLIKSYFIYERNVPNVVNENIFRINQDYFINFSNDRSNGLEIFVHLIHSILISEISITKFKYACNALQSMLCEFPPSNHPLSWGILSNHKDQNVNEKPDLFSFGLINFLLLKMKYPEVIADLILQSSCIFIVISLLSGIFDVYGLHLKEKGWSTLRFTTLKSVPQNIFLHLARIIRIIYCIVSHKKIFLTHEKMKNNQEKRKSKLNTNFFTNSQSPHQSISSIFVEAGDLNLQSILYFTEKQYSLLYNVLKSSYINIKQSLAIENADRFSSYLRLILDAFSHVIAFSNPSDIHIYVEELLPYLVRLLYVNPSNILQVVRKLITSLHGSVYECKWRTSSNDDDYVLKKRTFHDIFYSIPLRKINQVFFPHNAFEYLDCLSHVDPTHNPAVNKENLESQVHLRKKVKSLDSIKVQTLSLLSKKTKLKSQIARTQTLERDGSRQFIGEDDLLSNKVSFKEQIKHFENILTNSLLLYSTTCEGFQTELLSLLVDLIGYKLNYLLIDSNLIFLDKIIKQIEYIEIGSLRDVNCFISEIFQFFIVITINKPDVLPLSKIIQLSDSVMASGKSTIKFAIPSLIPIMFYIFPEISDNLKLGSTFTTGFLSFCNSHKSKIGEGHEDVVISMLIRLIEFPYIAVLLALLLNSRKTVMSKYLELSSMIIGPLLQKMKRMQVQFDNLMNFKWFEQLIFTLHESHISQITLFFKTINYTKDLNSISHLLRWFSTCILIIKIFFKLSDENLLLDIIANIDFLTPLINIPFIINIPEKTFDSFLIPEEKLSNYIFEIFYIFISIFKDAIPLQNTSIDCSYNLEYHLFLINEFIAFLSWIISDNLFPRFTKYLSLILYGDNDSFLKQTAISNSLLDMIYSISHYYPYLQIFVNYLILCAVRVDIPQKFWIIVIDLMTSNFKYCDNSLHSKIYQSAYLTCCYSLPSIEFSPIIQNQVFIKNIIIHHFERSTLMFLEDVRTNLEISFLMCGELHSISLRSFQQDIDAAILKTLEFIHPSFFLSVLNTCLKITSSSSHWGVKANCQKIIIHILDGSGTNILYSLRKSHIFYLNYLSFLRSESGKRLENLRYSLKSIVHREVFGNKNDFSDHNYGLIKRSISCLPASIDRNWSITKIFDYVLLTRPSLGYEAFLNLFNLNQFVEMIPIEHLDMLLYIIEGVNIFYSESNNFEISDMINPDIDTVYKLYKVSSKRLLVAFNVIVSGDENVSSYTILIASKCLVSLNQRPRVFSLSKEFSVSDCNLLLRFGSISLQCAIRLKPIYKSRLAVSFVSFSIILALDQMRTILTEISDILLFAIRSLYEFVAYILKTQILIDKILNTNPRNFQEKAHKMLSFLLTNLSSENLFHYIPQFLIYPIKSFLTSLCQIPHFYDLLIIPDCVWESFWIDESRRKVGTFPSLPDAYLQDPECFKIILKRIITLGWRTQDQFEEIWSLILRVLIPNFNSDFEFINTEEQILMCKTSCLAIEAVSSHLYMYLLVPDPGCRHPNFGFDLVDCGDTEYEWSFGRFGHLLNESLMPKLTILDTKIGRKISFLQSILNSSWINFHLQRDLIHSINSGNSDDVFRWCSTSVPFDYHGYSTNQYSLSPLLQQHMNEADSEDSKYYSKNLFKVKDVNLSSCIRLLCDIYQNWINEYPTKTPLFLFHLVLKSLLLISDLFTERAQYEWMFSLFTKIYCNRQLEDEISTIYLIIGTCKAAVIIDREKLSKESLIKIFESGLSSNLIPVILATLEGFLITTKLDSVEFLYPLLPQFSTCIRDFISNMQRYTTIGQNSQLILLSVGTILIEQFSHLIKDPTFPSNFISFLLSLCTHHSDCHNSNIVHAVISIFERLTLGYCLQQFEKSLVIKFSLSLIEDYSICNKFFSACSLLIACVYSGEEITGDFQSDLRGHLSQLENDPMTYNIDIIAQTRERLNLLLKVLLRNTLNEGKMIYKLVEYMFIDLLPTNQSMNIIVTEFLREKSMEKQLLGWIFAKLFQSLYSKGLRNEVKIWGLICIESFSQLVPMELSVWTLLFLFISISANPWIYNLLPFFLSRKEKKILIPDIDVFLKASLSFFNLLEHDEKSQFISYISQNLGFHPTISILLHVIQRGITTMQ